jgi:hypothetical protein
MVPKYNVFLRYSYLDKDSAGDVEKAADESWNVGRGAVLEPVGAS